MDHNPFTRFRHALLNNRWIQESEASTAPLSYPEILRKSIVGLLLVSVLGLPSIYELIYDGSYSNPLAFAMAIVLLAFAALFSCFIVIGITSNLKKKRGLAKEVPPS
jgi:hypothetical protein